MEDFKDKTILITGGSRGIGRGCCLDFARKRANIVFTYNKSKDAADDLLQELKEIGVKAFAYQVDIKDFNQCRAAADFFFEKFEKLDILVNNAGIIKDKPLMIMSEEDWHEVINTNLNGVFNITKQFVVSFMKQKEGNIINISSLSGVVGMPGQSNYSASKGGLNAFTRSLAKEVAYFNVRVNAVAPGFVNTDMIKDVKEEYINEIKSRVILKRFGNVDEVSSVVSFLASQKSAYITGQVIQVDGGLGL
tara:strand:- start:36 stop:782 length:747 start_codon:yes stop_codon:yes gene_type:complete